jgi:HSP20 family molecular chaperone IbpA
MYKDLKVDFSDFEKVLGHLIRPYVQTNKSELELNLPGLVKDSIEISLDEYNKIVVKAKNKKGKDIVVDTYIERQTLEGSTATYEDGVLLIKFKQTESSKVVKVT